MTYEAKKQVAARTSPETQVDDLPPQRPPGYLSHVLPELIVIAVSCFLWYRATGFRQVRGDALGPDFWPQMLCLLMGGTALCRLLWNLYRFRRLHRGELNAFAADDEDADDEPISRQRALTVIVLVIAYVPVVIYLGYPLGTTAFLLVFLWLAGKRNLLITVPVSVIGAFIFTYTFQQIVYVALPTGVGVFDTLTVWFYQLIGIY